MVSVLILDSQKYDDNQIYLYLASMNRAMQQMFALWNDLNSKLRALGLFLHGKALNPGNMKFPNVYVVIKKLVSEYCISWPLGIQLTRTVNLKRIDKIIELQYQGRASLEGQRETAEAGPFVLLLSLHQLDPLSQYMCVKVI